MKVVVTIKNLWNVNPQEKDAVMKEILTRPDLIEKTKAVIARRLELRPGIDEVVVENVE